MRNGYIPPPFPWPELSEMSNEKPFDLLVHWRAWRATSGEPSAVVGTEAGVAWLRANGYSYVFESPVLGLPVLPDSGLGSESNVHHEHDSSMGTLVEDFVTALRLNDV